MSNKILFYLAFLLIAVSWPISLVKSPPKIELKTIFYETEVDIIENNIKYSLVGNPLNKIFYNHFLIYTRRYVKNIFYLLDINNYFFNSHPREDILEYKARLKFTYISLIPFVVGIISLIKTKTDKKKLLKLIIPIILIIGFLKNPDGLDMVFYFPILTLIYIGSKKIFNHNLGMLFSLVSIFVYITEIWRIL